jgi:hypothetical protein
MSGDSEGKILGKKKRKNILNLIKTKIYFSIFNFFSMGLYSSWSTFFRL